MLRTLTVSGAPRARGHAHGEELRAQVERGVDRWRQAIEEVMQRPADAYAGEFLAAMDVEETIERWAPDLLEEVRGIAEGAALPFETLFAYNMVDELWMWAEDSDHGDLVTGETNAGRCSALALAAGPNGHPIVAQNMDVPVQYAGGELLLHVASETEPDALVLTAAGLIALCGANELGVAVCTNTLMAVRRARRGLPVLFAVRSTLRRRDLAEAVAHLREIPHCSGQNYLVGGPDGIASLECSAGAVTAYAPAADRIGHTNHPLVNRDVDADSLERDQPSSRERQAFLEAHLGAARSAEDLRRLLADRTVPVCKHGVALSDSLTWGSIVMELSQPPSIDVAVGPPDLNPYERVWPPR